MTVAVAEDAEVAEVQWGGGGGGGGGWGDMYAIKNKLFLLSKCLF